jgi:hypothetical protein
MEGTLVKREDRYDLYSEAGHKIASSAPSPHKKLSKQNCDEIFGVVDVEKIADRHTFGQRNHEWKAYIKGFSKAMELMKDKVFTLEQMHKAIRLACSEYSGNIIDEVTQQPTEIDVEIEMECCGNYSPPCNINCEYGGKPKLDSNSCLILKRKQ